MNEAEAIVRALGGEWRGNSGNAPCPVCQPEGRRDQRALSVTTRTGMLLVHCHRNACAAMAELRARGMISGGVSKGDRIANAQAAAKQDALDREQEDKRLRYAHAIFDAGVSCEGTPAQIYLEGRGLRNLRFSKLRRTIRFNPSVLHTASGQRLPTMLAQVRGPMGQRLGIHRTYLTDQGTKAPLTPAKMALGPTAGGAIRFGPDSQVICLAEGIETALSVSMASRMTTWACLSATGMRGLILPPLPIARIVILAADADPAGISAAEAAADRFEREGRSVSIIAPSKAGQDWNDVLQGESAAAAEGGAGDHPQGAA